MKTLKTFISLSFDGDIKKPNSHSMWSRGLSQTFLAPPYS